MSEANNGSVLGDGAEKKQSAAEKKAAKVAVKEARQAAAAALAASKSDDASVVENGGIDSADGTFGPLVLVQSAFKDDRKWTEIADLSANEVKSGAPNAVGAVWIR